MKITLIFPVSSVEIGKHPSGLGVSRRKTWFSVGHLDQFRSRKSRRGLRKGSDNE